MHNYEAAKEVFEKREDLKLEYASLLNHLGRYEEAYAYLMASRFHPWEGGEGKVTTQYVTALVELAMQAMERGDLEKAKKDLHQALIYPENLGEGKLEGTKDNHIYYYLGLVMEKLGKGEEARKYFEMACQGEGEAAGIMYYNDQPADMIYYQGLAMEKCGKTKEGKACFNKLLDYGEQHLFDQVKLPYFAVSLPDFLIFEDNLEKRRQAHCHYLIGLGKLGLGDRAGACEALEEAGRLAPEDLMAGRYLRMAKEGGINI